MTRRRRRRDPAKPTLLRPRLDPGRRRLALSRNASIEESIEDFFGWVIAAGFSPAAAERRAEWIERYYCGTGKSPALSLEEKAAVIAEFDRQLDELDRQDAEDVDQ